MKAPNVVNLLATVKPFENANDQRGGPLWERRVAAVTRGAGDLTANAICPAYVRTPLVEQQIEDQANEHGVSRQDAIKDVMLEETAVKCFVEPEEMAAMATELCSGRASSITGVALTIDAGWTAR